MFNILNNITSVTTKSEILKDIPTWQSKLNNEYLSVLHVNLMSIERKWDLLCVNLDPVIEQLDILVLTEIDVNEVQATAYQLRGFIQVSKCRVRKGGGGVMVFVRDTFQIEDMMYNFDQADNLVLKINDTKSKMKYILIAVYRSPKLDLNKFLTDLDFWVKNATKKDDLVIMIGDINVCLLKKTSVNMRYLNILNQNTMIPMIREITREEMLAGAVTVSSIDHINLRCKNNTIATASVICDKPADHYYIALRISKDNPGDPRRNNKITKTILDTKKIQEEISKVDWNKLTEVHDPEKVYFDTINEFNQIYDSCTKSVEFKKKHIITPWVSKRTLLEINKKNELYSQWKNNKNAFKYERYKEQRNIVTNLIKKEKRIYCYKKFKDAKGDMRKTWRLINELMDRKRKESPEEVLKKNFKTDNAKILANNFNKNFIQQIRNIQLKNQGPELQVNLIDHTPHSSLSSFFLRKASTHDVVKILKNMKKTGRGIDGVRSGDVIRNIPLFAPLLTHFVNLCLKTGSLPDALKISAITPLYKRNKLDDLSSYRPVGSMVLAEKLVEKHINNQIKKYLTENEILPSFQHGFQAGKSTMTLLQDFSEIINTALDEKMAVVIIFLDLSLAFDTLSHSILVKKLKEVGITHPLLINNFFLNRKQVTRVGDVKSETEDVKQGLVQGGINSPTFYNVYTYDVKYLPRKCTLKMFADDSCIISVHKNVQTAVHNAQTDFIDLQKYFYKNSIFLNEKKTETMVLGYASKQIDMSQHKIYCHSRDCLVQETYMTSCCCHQADYASKVKYLGMTIDNEFKMKDHVQQLNKKMRIVNYKLKKINADCFPLTTKNTIYFSLVDSLLRYGAPMYNFAPAYTKEPLYNMQEKIKKFLFKNNENIEILTPDQIAKFILITLNFHKEEFRQLTDQPYALRRQRFKRIRVNTITFGERRLGYILPTLLNDYCQDFLDERVKWKLKDKLKKHLLSIPTIR